MLFMKDVCAITGLNSSTIRYYDGQGLLGEVNRSSNNYRVFDEKDVEKLIFIKKSRDLRFDLQEIKKILTLKEKGILPCDYVSERIEEKISYIESEIMKLEDEKMKLKKHLSDARKVTGCRGSVCHYIEGNEDIELFKLKKETISI